MGFKLIGGFIRGNPVVAWDPYSVNVIAASGGRNATKGFVLGVVFHIPRGIRAITVHQREKEEGSCKASNIFGRPRGLADRGTTTIASGGIVENERQAGHKRAFKLVSRRNFLL